MSILHENDNTQGSAVTTEFQVLESKNCDNTVESKFPCLAKYTMRCGNSNLKVASSELMGYRKTMEDEQTIELALENHPDTSFFGIFDGHGGDEAAKICKALLHKNIDGLDDPLDPVSIRGAVRQLDEDCLGVCNDSGSTAVFLVVQPKIGVDNEWTVTVGNVGDSRAVLIRDGGHIIELTTDHKPDIDSEYKRIIAAGGTVERGRVDGDLAMSRAIGDAFVKSDSSRPPHLQKVICDPEISKVTVQQRDLILLMCDGLLEEMNVNDICSFVYTKYRKTNTEDAGAVLQSLIDVSVAKGSLDNHTVMLISFEDGSDFKTGGQFVPSAYHSQYFEYASRFGLLDRKSLLRAARFAQEIPLEELKEFQVEEYDVPENCSCGRPGVVKCLGACSAWFCSLGCRSAHKDEQSSDFEFISVDSFVEEEHELSESDNSPMRIEDSLAVIDPEKSTRNKKRSFLSFSECRPSKKSHFS